MLELKRNLTDERVLFVLEDAYPNGLGRAEIRDATGINDKQTLRRSLRRLLRLGFITERWEFNGGRGRPEAVFVSNPKKPRYVD